MALCCTALALGCGEPDEFQTIRGQSDADALGPIVEGLLVVEVQGHARAISFEHVEVLRGSLQISQWQHLDLEFPKLERIEGRLSVADGEGAEIRFPVLEEITLGVRLQRAKAVRVDAPMLHSTGPKIVVDGVVDGALAFPRLSGGGRHEVTCVDCTGVELTFPEVRQVARLRLEAVDALTTPQFERIGRLDIKRCAREVLIDAPEIREVFVENCSRFDVELRAVERLARLMVIASPQTHAPALKAAESVSLEAELNVSRFEQMPARGFLLNAPHLDSIGTLVLTEPGRGYTIAAREIRSITVRDWQSELVFSGVEHLESLEVGQSVDIDFQVLRRLDNGRLSTTPAENVEHVRFPELVSAGSLSFDGMGAPALRVVDRDLALHPTGQLGLPNLTRVGGDLSLHAAGVRQTVLPSLKSVAGDLVLQAPWASLPELTAVGGHLTVLQHHVAMNRLRRVDGDVIVRDWAALFEISYPSLEVVSGTLSFSNHRLPVPPLVMPNLTAIGFICDDDGCAPHHDRGTCASSILVQAPGLTTVFMPRLQHVLGTLRFNAPCESLEVGDYLPPKECQPLCSS